MIEENNGGLPRSGYRDASLLAFDPPTHQYGGCEIVGVCASSSRRVHSSRDSNWLTRSSAQGGHRAPRRGRHSRRFVSLPATAPTRIQQPSPELKTTAIAKLGVVGPVQGPFLPDRALDTDGRNRVRSPRDRRVRWAPEVRCFVAEVGLNVKQEKRTQCAAASGWSSEPRPTCSQHAA